MSEDYRKGKKTRLRINAKRRTRFVNPGLLKWRSERHNIK